MPKKDWTSVFIFIQQEKQGCGDTDTLQFPSCPHVEADSGGYCVQMHGSQYRVEITILSSYVAADIDIYYIYFCFLDLLIA